MLSNMTAQTCWFPVVWLFLQARAGDVNEIKQA